MVVLTKVLGSARDLPQMAKLYVAAAAAGAGADYEHPVLTLPNLASAAPAGAQGNVPFNDLYLRLFDIVPEAAVAGAATNNMLWGFKQRRAGNVLNQITTQNTGAISVGANTVVPVTGTLMQYIAVGTVLHIAAGGGTAEDVIVTAVVPGVSFTATFAFTHTANTAITGVYLAAVWYNGTGVTEAAYTPHQLIALPNQVLPGDVLTFARVSYGTGLSGGSPGVLAGVEWALLNNNAPLG